MLIMAVSFDPEQTGLSVEELKTVEELCSNELFQKFFRAQHKAILTWAIRDSDPFTEKLSDKEYREGMQKIHAIASIWLQIAEATAKQE